RFAPAHPVPHGRVTGRHRLAVEADLLAQAPRDARFRVGELHPLGPNPTPPTVHASLTIDQRHRMRRPGQVVPGAVTRRPHATRVPATATAWIAAGPAPLDPNPHPTRCFRVLSLNALYAEPGQPQDPRTIAPRSHASSLVASTTRENDTGWSGDKLDRSTTSRPPSRPPTPRAVRAGGRVLPQIAVLKSVNSRVSSQAKAASSTMDSVKSSKVQPHQVRCRIST